MVGFIVHLKHQRSRRFGDAVVVRVSMRSSRKASSRSERFAPRRLSFLTLQVAAVVLRQPNAGLAQVTQVRKRKNDGVCPSWQRYQSPAANFPRVYPVHPQLCPELSGVTVFRVVTFVWALFAPALTAERRNPCPRIVWWGSGLRAAAPSRRNARLGQGAD